MKVQVKKEVAEFFESTASMVKINSNTYYYMPFWFKTTEDKEIFDELNWDELPKDLINFITSLREGEKP